MPELSRSQLLVYAVIAVAVILIGARWIRSSGNGTAGGAELSFAAGSAREAEGGEDVGVHGGGRGPPPGRLPPAGGLEGDRCGEAGRRFCPRRKPGRDQPRGPPQRRPAGG